MVDFQSLEEEYGDKITKRIAEYERAVAFYLKCAQEDIPAAISFKNNTAETLTYLYFIWHYKLVKPFVKDLSDRYKVASITEFAICYLQPISIEGYSSEQLRFINADFAFFCALNIMANFKDEDESVHFGTPHFKPFSGAIAPLEERLEKVLENHKRYLTTFDDTNNAPPLISNAHSLELIDMFYTFKWQALSV